MRFSKLFVLCACCVLSLSALAQHSGKEDEHFGQRNDGARNGGEQPFVLKPNEAALLRYQQDAQRFAHQKALTVDGQKDSSKRTGSASGQQVDAGAFAEHQAHAHALSQSHELKALFSPDVVAAQTHRYKKAAEAVAGQSQRALPHALKQLGLSDRQAHAFANPMGGQELGDVKAIFISLSMPRQDIIEAMKAAVASGSQLFVNGILPEHESVMDMAMALRQIGQNLDVKPDVRFKPKLFEAHAIEAVPTAIITQDGRTTLVAGMLNMGWLQGKHNELEEDKHLGNRGPVWVVEEPSIIETLRQRMAGYDWSGKKEKALDGYWRKAAFKSLPDAKRDGYWYIDPTVKVTADITMGPHNDVLAKEGEVVNPIQSVGVGTTLYVFNPRNTEQLEWVTRSVQEDGTQEQVMLLFSELERDKGWDHLSALRKHFERELYLLPKALVDKFGLEALPVKITTDTQQNLFKVEQFSLGGGDE